MNSRSINQFKTLMKRSDQVGDGVYKATTTKRESVIIPKGMKIFDTDENRWYYGDDSTYGGRRESTEKKVRKIAVSAAASGATVVSGTDIWTWSSAAYLRTGDAVTIASGAAGSIPSGVSAGTYYLIKQNDNGNSENNTGTTFKLASTRSNAIAGTAVDVLGDGSAFNLVYSDICVQPNDEMILIDPVSADVGVVLPDADSNGGLTCTIKRATTATYSVNVKELDASGNISASGSVTIDDTAGYITLKAGTDDFVRVFADSDAGEYWTIASQITA